MQHSCDHVRASSQIGRFLVDLGPRCPYCCFSRTITTPTAATVSNSNERICSSYTPFLIALNPMTIPAQILVRIHTFENKKLQPVPGEYRLNSRSEFKFDPRQATSVLFLFCFDFWVQWPWTATTLTDWLEAVGVAWWCKHFKRA